MTKKIEKIAISGGKGGVGKSTFAVLLTKKLVESGKKVVLVDCDVECPNDYLLLSQKLNKEISKTYTDFPKLIKSKCKKCGICAQKCPNNAIFFIPNKYPIFLNNLCLGCGLCEAVCPFGAIKMKKEETGKIYLNKVEFKSLNFYLITGLAKAGLEETGPIVAQTKKVALEFAKKIKADYILFDTAAGTHCPVITALLGVDFAFLITEPTPMGTHDLELMIDLCKKLKIKASVVLNQANLGNRKLIENLLKKYKMKIEKEIPYSKEIAKAYSGGKILDLKSVI